MHLHGEYSTSLPDVIIHNNSSNSEIKSPVPIEITYGYSRDHRPDLKQFIIDLISSVDGDVPIFLKTASGNQSNSSSFAKIFLEYQEQMQKEKIENEDSLMVADAALYNAKNISSLSGTRWLCRVPITIGLAKDAISTLLSTDFISSSLTGYYYSVVRSNYGGVEQRWLVVESTERKESDLRKLEKRISKSKK
nr:IS1634 family transposase [Iningainema tapete]